MWTTARRQAPPSAATAEPNQYPSAPAHYGTRTVASEVGGAGQDYAEPYFAPQTRRRPHAIIQAAVVDADAARAATAAHAGAPHTNYRPKAARQCRSTPWPAIRWTLAGFAFGIAFWHLVGFWQFIGQVILAGHSGSAKASTEQQLATVQADMATNSHILASPAAGCTALIRNPSGMGTFSAPCSQAVGQMKAGSGLGRGNRMPHLDKTAASLPAGAPTAAPVWSATVVQTSPNQ